MKKQKTLLRLWAILLLVSTMLIPQEVWALSTDTDGYYKIGSATDLSDFRTLVNGGSNSIKGKLTANFSISSGAYTPIGTSSKPFSGTFDGKGYTITFSGATSSSDNFGLFGYVSNATIQDLRVAGTMTVSGTKSHIGGIVAYLKNASNIKGCTFSGTLDAGSSKDCIGGIVGYAESSFNGSITNCFCNGTLKTTATSGDRYIGGILGYFNDESSKKPTIQYNFSDTQFKNGSSNLSGDFINGIIGRIRNNATNIKYNTCIANGDVSRAMQSGNTDASIDASNKAITISVSSNNTSYGTVSKSYVNPTSTSQTLLQVSATSNTHYHFSKWSDNRAQTHTVGLTSAVSLTATFAIDQHTITANSNNTNYGTVTGGGTYNYGATVSLKATPNAGYHFVQWNDGNKNASRSVTVTGNDTYTATFHQLTAHTATAATCTTTGNNAYWTCSTCNKYYSDNKGSTTTTLTTVTIAALNHDYTSKTTTPTYLMSDATCTAAAKYYYKCSRCTDKGSESYSSTEDKDKALGHGFTCKTKAKIYLCTSATCTDDETYYYNCSRCSVSGTETWTLKGTKLGHDYTSKTTTPTYLKSAATCTEAATYYYKCSRCTEKGSKSYSSTENKDKALGHDYTSMTTTPTYLKSAATCTEAATYYYKCSRCTGKGSESYRSTEDKDKPGHSYSDETETYCTTCQQYFIHYRAYEKLVETESSSTTSGLHTNSFSCAISSHTFAEDEGTISFSDAVTSIGQYAFYGCTGLQSITLPSSVTTIGNEAFDCCSGLQSISIPSNVTSIGDYAFHDCTGLQSITLPSNVTSIGNGAFVYCTNLSSISVDEDNTVYDSRNGCNAIITKADSTLIAGCKNTTIPSSVTSIGNNAFNGCSGLQSITLPSGLTSIGYQAFSNCSGLQSITLPGSVTTIGDQAFYGCTSLLDVTFNAIPKVGAEVFTGCTNLNNNITLALSDDSYVATDKGDFPTLYEQPTYTHTLTTEWETVVIPFDVEITENDNYECYTLSRVNGSSLEVTKMTGTIAAGTPMMIRKKEAGDYALTLNGVANGEGSYTVSTSINNTDVNGLTLTGTYAKQTVTSGYVLDGTQFTKVTAATEVSPFRAYLAGSIDEEFTLKLIIPYTYFYYTATKQVTPNSDDFTDKDNKKLTYTNTFDNQTGNGELEFVGILTSIGYTAFQNCTSLTSVTIPNSVTTIGNDAFKGCSNLTSVTIPNSVKTIGTGAFQNCLNLTSVTIPSSVETIGWSSFMSCSSLASVTIPNSVKTIKIKAFSKCSSLESISIPNSVTSIGAEAFSDCTNLTNVTIGNSVSSIGNDAFKSCPVLSSIVVEGNPKYDSRNGCNAIIETQPNILIVGCKSTVIPNTVTVIGRSAFYQCSNLTSITIPSSVTSIRDYAFQYCSRLSSVTIPNSVISIGNRVFSYCDSLPVIDNIRYADTYLLNVTDKSLSEYTIKEGTRFIGNDAFNSCSKLIKSTIPSSVTSIGNDAFRNCTSLTDIEFQSISKVGTSVFYNVPSTCLYTLALSDDSYVAADKGNFPTTVTSATYARTGSKSQWATIMVPFDLNNSDKYCFYTLTNVSASELTITRQNELPAGTPALVYMTEEAKNAETGLYDLNLEVDSTSISTDIQAGSSAGGLTLTGTYTAQDIANEDGYFISGGKFYSIAAQKAKNSAIKINLGAFRAYLKGTLNGPNPSASLRLSVSDEEIETVLEVLDSLSSREGWGEAYDLNGRPIDALHEGVNIIKKGNKSIKVIVK